MAKAKPISLNPLKLDDILRIMVTTPAAPAVKKSVRPKRSKSKSSSKASS